jgi:diguanylate cyclase (GGDEF)-like protein/PAS domain S-box-containing protein
VGRAENRGGAVQHGFEEFPTAKPRSTETTEPLTPDGTAILRGLHDLATSANGLLDPTQVALVAVQHTRLLLEADQAVLYHWNQERNSLSVLADTLGGRSTSGRGNRGVVIPKSGLVSRALDLGEPTRVDDCANLGEIDSWAVKRGARTAAAAPLIFNQQILGVLAVQRCTIAPFSGQHLDHLGMIANQVAPSLEAARLYAQSERKRSQAETLAEIMRRGSEERDPERVMAIVCELASRLIGAEHCGIQLTDDEGNQSWHGLYGAGEGFVSGSRLSLGRGPSSRAIQEGRTVVVDGFRRIADALQGRSAWHPFTTADTFLATPLFYRDHPVGALVLAWREEVLVTAEQIQMAEAVAGYAATVVERSRHVARRRLLSHEARAKARALEASEERLRKLYGGLACGVLVRDVGGTVTHANEVAEEILGMSFAEMRGHDTAELWTARDERGRELQGPDRPGRVALRTREPVRKRLLEVIRPDGESRWIQLDAIPVVSSSDNALEVVSSFLDVTERKRAEQALEHQALYDPLTGLANRALCLDRIRQAIASSKRHQRPFALLLMDLNRFKEINDTLGHHCGDQVLVEVGERLRRTLRASDTVARLGGDEFALLLLNVQTDAVFQTTAKLLRSLEQPFFIENQAVNIEASIGVALYPEHGCDADTLLRHADVAMYAAKRAGVSSTLYSATHEVHDPADLALMAELRQAIERGELFLRYQPKIDCRRGEIAGVEALVGWNHPYRGTLLPDRFLPLAEHTGLIHPLSRWVLNAALYQVHLWQEAGLDIPVAINMSARNLIDAQLPALVADTLAAYGLEPRSLEIEITETSIMSSCGQAVENLMKLRELGVRVAIDDFGTGFSSLTHLRRVPIDALKIDKSFVIDMSKNEDDAAIVRTTIDLAHNLRLQVVAEGVEDQASLDSLTSLGCDIVQGYHVCRPVLPMALGKWLRASPWKLPRASAESSPRQRVDSKIRELTSVVVAEPPDLVLA